jgi:NitT/TauT family transport system permease protein
VFVGRLTANLPLRGSHLDGRQRWRAPFLRLAVFVGFVASWQVLAVAANNIGIPTFTNTALAAFDLAFVNGQIWGALASSNQALVVGYAISVLISVPLGLAAGRSRLLGRALEPYTAILLTIPVAPLIPIVISALGLTLGARVLVVILFSAVFIFVNARAGVRSVDSRLVEMAVSFGANERMIWRKVVIPAAVPAIFAGLRIGLGRALAGMVIVELVLVAVGIGRLLLIFSARQEPANVYATVFFVLAEALLLLEVARFIERKAAPWNG